jgi:cytoskeletal protein CcmA (bactofilin family)
MWNRRNEEDHNVKSPAARPNASEPRTEPAPREVAAPPAPRPAPVEPPRQVAVIGASMTIKGEIRSREELVVDGEIEGVLELQHSVTIGPNGKVRANIKAREVVIFGSVRGNVEVTNKIAIRQKGTLVGDIKAAGIVIDDGAYFKGSIDIIRAEPAQSKPALQNAG